MALLALVILALLALGVLARLLQHPGFLIPLVTGILIAVGQQRGIIPDITPATFAYWVLGVTGVCFLLHVISQEQATKKANQAVETREQLTNELLRAQIRALGSTTKEHIT